MVAKFALHIVVRCNDTPYFTNPSDAYTANPGVDIVDSASVYTNV